MRRIIWAVILAVLLSGTAGAVDVMQEEAEILGVQAIRDGLPAQSAAVMEDVSLEKAEHFGEKLWEILTSSIAAAGDWLRDGVRVCAALLAVALISGTASAAGGTRVDGAARMAGCLAIAALCTAELGGMVSLARQTMDELSTFSSLLLPVLCSALVASGGVSSGSAIYAGATFLISVLLNLIRAFLIPCVYGYLFLATAEHAIDDGRLTRLRELTGWGIKTVLQGAVAAFTVYLAVTGMLAGTTDGLTMKAAKGVMSAAIPVVGSMISEASQAVLTSAGLIRQAAGAFGMLAVLATALEPFLQIAILYLALRVTAALGGFVSQKAQAELFGCAAEAVGYLLAMTGSAVVMLLVAVCAFMKAVGG